MSVKNQDDGEKLSLQEVGDYVLEDSEPEDIDKTPDGNVSPTELSRILDASENIGIAYSGPPIHQAENPVEYGRALRTRPQIENAVLDSMHAIIYLGSLTDQRNDFDGWFGEELPKPSYFSPINIDVDEAGLDVYEVSDSSGNQFKAYVLSGIEIGDDEDPLGKANPSEYAFIFEK